MLRWLGNAVLNRVYLTLIVVNFALVGEHIYTILGLHGTDTEEEHLWIWECFFLFTKPWVDATLKQLNLTPEVQYCAGCGSASARILGYCWTDLTQNSVQMHRMSDSYTDCCEIRMRETFLVQPDSGGCEGRLVVSGQSMNSAEWGTVVSLSSLCETTGLCFAKALGSVLRRKFLSQICV